MSATTAKVAGVKNIIACSPPKEGIGASPSVIYTANLCGADTILNLGLNDKTVLSLAKKY